MGEIYPVLSEPVLRDGSPAGRCAGAGAGCALCSLVTLGAVHPVPLGAADCPRVRGGCADGFLPSAGSDLRQPEFCTDPKADLPGAGPQRDDGEGAQVPQLSDFPGVLAPAHLGTATWPRARCGGDCLTDGTAGDRKGRAGGALRGLQTGKQGGCSLTSASDVRESGARPLSSARSLRFPTSSQFSCAGPRGRPWGPQMWVNQVNHWTLLAGEPGGPVPTAQGEVLRQAVSLSLFQPAGTCRRSAWTPRWVPSFRQSSHPPRPQHVQQEALTPRAQQPGGPSLCPPVRGPGRVVHRAP